MVTHKIARLVVVDNPSERKLNRLLNKFISKTNDKHFEFIITPGGFLSFNFPKDIKEDIDINEVDENQLELLQLEASKVIKSFFEKLKKSRLQKLKEMADYITIGIDGANSEQTQFIELIAVYSLKQDEIVRWTGKFYPTEGQKRRLIKFNNLDSHFIELNNQKIVVLGCHDLNVYNPRGQAAAKPGGYKKEIANDFKLRCKQFQPDIILQHPHTTDSPNIWNLAWRTVEKELPSVKHFASAIKYHNWNGDCRRDLDSVLEKTKKGDVEDFLLN